MKNKYYCENCKYLANVSWTKNSFNYCEKYLEPLDGENGNAQKCCRCLCEWLDAENDSLRATISEMEKVEKNSSKNLITP